MEYNRQAFYLQLELSSSFLITIKHRNSLLECLPSFIIIIQKYGYRKIKNKKKTKRGNENN